MRAIWNIQHIAFIVEKKKKQIRIPHFTDDLQKTSMLKLKKIM